MLKTMGYFDKAMRTMVEKIELTLGGNVILIKNSEQRTITIDWKKNDKTVNALHFQKVYSYEELEQLSNPNLIAADFLETYKNYLKPKVLVLDTNEKPKAKRTKVEKVEEPEVEELKVEEPEVEELKVEEPKAKVTRAKKAKKFS